MTRIRMGRELMGDGRWWPELLPCENEEGCWLVLTCWRLFLAVNVWRTREDP